MLGQRFAARPRITAARRNDDQGIDGDAARYGQLPDRFQRLPVALRSVSGNVDDLAAADVFVGLDHVRGEGDRIADRVGAPDLPGCRDQPGAEAQRRGLVTNDGPVDDHRLAVGRRPFDEGDGDLLMIAALDGRQHGRVGQRRRVAGALQCQFVVIDRAGPVGGKNEFEVHGLLCGGVCGAGHAEQDGDNQIPDHFSLPPAGIFPHRG